MIQIDDKIISPQILQEHFCCNLQDCKGMCCVYGDAGAPLLDNEAAMLEEIYPLIKNYLRPEAIEAIEKQGTWETDSEHEKVTPLVNDKECAYVLFENGVAICAIEKAFLDKKITFRKPISCHLYPIRVKSYNTFHALNYDKWSICEGARLKGQEQKLPVYRFCKDALVRAFGKEWYEKVEIAAGMLNQD